ncbi:MAG: hypothetical protein ACXVW6_02625 [Nocardioidaceae bacterium]
MTEPTGFVAAVTSFHVDGRIRQRATRVLAELDGIVPATALAARLLDHVPQVREEAQRALLPRLDAGNAAAVLGVLLAGRGRQHAPNGLASVREALFEKLPAIELVETLLRGGAREVRRWAFTLGHDRGLLTPGRLLRVVHDDPDQWLRASAADWLLPVADPQQLRELLGANTVEARLVALTQLPDDSLGDDDLLPLLADRAPRVREQARWRARRRGIDTARWYRERVALPETPAQTLAASLDGLAAVGGPGDLERFTEHLHHRSPRVRTAAVTGVSTHASREVAVATLAPVLLDPSPRVSSAAARLLVRLRAPQEAAAAAWSSPQSWSRRAAWRMSRGAGSWDWVEADLRAAADTDPQLASLGRAGVRNWLATSAATTWAALPDSQRERIQELLVAGPVDSATSRTVAFHARIQVPSPPVPAPAGTTTDADVPAPTRRWLRLVRRR